LFKFSRIQKPQDQELQGFPTSRNLMIDSLRRYNPLLFLRQVRQELKKVEWPTREKTAKLTVLVIAASVLVGGYIGGLDAVFTYLLTYLVK